MDKTKLRTLVIPVDMSLKHAMQRLSDTCEKILFVVDSKDRLLGTINDGDIRRGIINSAKFQDPVKNIMCREFCSIPLGLPDMKNRVKKLMVKRNIEQIPVLDERGVIVDVVIWTDFLRKGKAKTKKMHRNQVVIMAGGKGTRLDPFTKVLPKPLIPIGEKPVIEHIMEKFHQYGFHRFIYTLNYKKEYLKLFLRENSFSYEIDFVEEDDFLGTAGGLSILKEKITDTFFVVNCDSLLDVDFEQVLRWHKEQRAAITVVGCHNEVKIPFGVLQLCDGRLRKILEKPVHDVIVNTGTYLLEPHVLSRIPYREHLDMNTLVDSVARKAKVAVYPISGGWLDMGQWNEYKRNLYMLEQNDGVIPRKEAWH